MSKALIIAEKPSVAADIARALGKVPKVKEYFENNDYIITSAVGHLVELCLPEELEKKRGKWSFANLPVIPNKFELRPIEKTESQLNLIKRLIKRKDVDLIINACDAGREGELIFRYIIQLSGTDKPSRRLWLQSMTAEAIRSGFEKLRSDQEMTPLGEAAICRSESDWLVGINGTRALTAFNSKSGGFQLTPVGRVQTPTLAILAEREEKIRAFKPRTYFEIIADFQVQEGNYTGRWFDEGFKKSSEEDTDARAERVWDREKADAIVAKCQNKPGIITEEKKPSSQASPLLYDLTTLQREANARFHFSARRTLQIAQALYERHKVLTYPRTDSRYLPEDNLANVKAVFTKFEDPSLASHAQKALKNDWIKLNKRIFNNAKVTDHHAIIPTGVYKKLDEAEQKIFDMVARRFIAVFYPAAQFEITTRITRVEQEPFKSEGKIIVDPGWLAVYGKQAAGEDVLTPVTPNEQAETKKVECKENQTKPPARFSEATLLSAMEGAGKLVDDEELRAAMSQRGLGTPATRAQIIEGLILDGYVHREGRELIATAKGMSLITLLRAIDIAALASPEMTGEWEYKLKQMEQGALRRPEFMNEIRLFTEEIVSKAKGFSGEEISGNFEDLDAPCPKCKHQGFKETFRTYECKGCGLIVWKNMAGRELERSEVRTLLENGKVGPLEGFRSKLGRPFAAIIRLDENQKATFDFGENAGSEEQKLDITNLPQLGTCPVCHKGIVVDSPNAYVCSEATGPQKTCTFRLGKVILQREIPVDQARKIVELGKTDLIPRFISKKGRPFPAYLKLENGKIVFEFQEKEKKESQPQKRKGTEKESKKGKAP